MVHWSHSSCLFSFLTGNLLQKSCSVPLPNLNVSSAKDPQWQQQRIPDIKYVICSFYNGGQSCRDIVRISPVCALV